MPTPTLTYTVATRYAQEAGGEGVLPLVVQARANITAATDELGNAVSYPAHLFHFLWDFGDDPDNEETVVDPLRNVTRRTDSEQIGPQAAHTYTIEGDYTITCRAYYYATDSGTWVEMSPATSGTIEARDWTSVTGWESVHVNPGSTAADELGTEDAPFKTVAQLRAAIDNADKLAVYLATDQTYEAPDTDPVLTLTDNKGLRFFKYTPAGEITSTDPVLKLASGASGKAVVSVTPNTAANQQNEQQQLTVSSATSGTYTLTFNGETTTALAYNADAATIQAALEALSTIGAGNVSVTGTGPFTIEFTSALANANQTLVSVAYDGTLFPDGTAEAVVERLQHGSADDSTVENVVFSNIKLDGNSTTGSRGLEIVPVATTEGYATDLYLRDCRVQNVEGECVYVANTLSGANGPTAIGFVRTTFDHSDPASDGHTVHLACLSYALALGCAFRGGNGDIDADDHLHVPQFSTTQEQTDLLFRWNGFQSANEKNYCVRLKGGVRRAWVFGNNFTGTRNGLSIDKDTADAVTHPTDIIVEGNAFNNLGLQDADQARGLYVRLATNISVRNNLFYENGHDQSTVYGSDIHVDDALGGEESAGDAGPIRIEHNSFYRSWAKCGSPHLLIDDYRYIEHYNNAYHYEGSPSGSSANRSIIRFTDGAYSGTGKFESDGNSYYAPNLTRDGEIKPFVMGGTAFVEFDADGDTADWKNNNTAAGAVVFDASGAYQNPEFRNPRSGNFRFSITDALVDFCADTPRRTRFDYRGAVRSSTADGGAFEFDGTGGDAAYVYEPTALVDLPTAEGWNYLGGDIRYIELTEPVAATGEEATDIDNRPHHNLAHRDNLIGAAVDGLLIDINNAFCAEPQSGSNYTAPHKSIASFIGVAHNPDGTLKLNAADLAVLGFLRTDGTNQMLADLNVGDNRVINVAAAQQGTDAPQMQQVVQRAGDSMVGDLTFDGSGLILDMGGNRIQGLIDATAAGEPLNYGQAVLKVGDSMSGSLTLTGDTTSVVLNMNGHWITNLKAATLGHHAVRRDQVLLLLGGTMTGPINMGGQKITNLGAAAAAADAVRRDQAVLIVGSIMTGPLTFSVGSGTAINTAGGQINMNGGKIVNVGAAVNATDVPQYEQCIRVDVEDTKNTVLNFREHTWDGGGSYGGAGSVPDNSSGPGLFMSAVPRAVADLQDGDPGYFDGHYIDGDDSNPAITQATGNAIFGLAYPTKGHDAANKRYVDDKFDNVALEYLEYDAPDPTSLPSAFSGLAKGKWVVHAFGALQDAGGGDPYDLDLTINGKNRDIHGDDYPDGNAPWHITMLVTVSDSGDGTGTLTVNSMTSGATLEGFVAYRITPSTA